MEKYDMKVSGYADNRPLFVQEKYKDEPKEPLVHIRGFTYYGECQAFSCTPESADELWQAIKQASEAVKLGEDFERQLDLETYA